MPDPSSALLALWNDVDPDVEAAYNAWHAHEHVPERCSVPGILWGRRYRCVADEAVPRYLTLYGLRDVQVLDSAPYRHLLSHPTSASRAMRPALRNLSRWVCSLHQNLATGEAGHLAVWTSAERPADARPCCSAGRLLAERVPDAAPLPWLTASQVQGIEGRWLLCAERGGIDSAPVPDGAMLHYRLAVG